MVSGSIQLGLRQPPGHVSIMPPLWKYAQHRFLQSLHLYEVSPLWSDTQGRKQSCNHCLISHFPSLPQLRVAAAWQLQEREAGSQKHHYQIGKERLLAGFEAHYTAARQATFSISTFFFLSRRTWADEGTTAPSTTQDKSWFITKVALFLLIRCYGLGFGWLGFCFGLGFFFPWETASLIQSTYFKRGLFQEFHLHTFLCGSQYWAWEVGYMQLRLFQLRSLEEVLLTTQSPIWNEWELHSIEIFV